MSEEIQPGAEEVKQKSPAYITIKQSTYNLLTVGIIVAVGIAMFLVGYFVANSSVSEEYVTNSELNDKLDEIQQPAQLRQSSNSPAQSIFQISLDDDPFKGVADAPIVMVEFSDFQCPFCLRFYDQTLPALIDNYVNAGIVKFVYRDLPLDNLHPNARSAHIAAECADEQGMFWEYHDMLFENQAQWNILASPELSSQLSQYASTLGLNSASFESCLLSQRIADEVNDDYLEAASYGVTGTPTFFIGTEKDGFIKLVGAQPYADFQSAIDNLLN